MSSGETSAKIKVKMFGDFSIEIRGNKLSNLKGRTKRVWMLIQYLVAKRFEPVELPRLVEDIWDDRNCGDPENALKNLVYRARVLLHDLSGDEKSQFIIFLNGTYMWNNQYACEVDSERFVELCGEAEKAGLSDDARISLYQKALKLYCGEFLPRSAYSKWVIALSTAYSDLYRRSVRALCILLDDQERYDDLISVCQDALSHFPYEESLHMTLLSAYVNAGQRGKAFEHYNWATKLFYREFGVDLAKTFLPYYKELVSSGNRVEQDLNAIKKDLREAADVKGAYFCDYDVFKAIYRTQVRMLTRTGQSAFLALFTLSDAQGEPPRPEETKLAADRLKNVVIENLRKGDAAASYSATQFIVLLPLTTFENTQTITSRIVRKFRFDYRKSNIKLTAKVTPLE